MADFYIVNKEILRKGRDYNKCLCKVEEVKCPCDDFLEKDECICGAYKKIKTGDQN